MNYTFLDLLGNIGVLLIILAYLLLQINKLSSSTLLYSVMNLFGASLVIVSLVEDFNLSAFIIEAFWVLISLIGIFNYSIKNTKNKVR